MQLVPLSVTKTAVRTPASCRWERFRAEGEAAPGCEGMNPQSGSRDLGVNRCPPQVHRVGGDQVRNPEGKLREWLPPP